MSAESITTSVSLLNALGAYFIGIFLAIFAMMAMFWGYAGADSFTVQLYVGAATAGYAALYALGAVLASVVLLLLLRPHLRPARWKSRVVLGAAYLGGVVALTCLYADYRLYELYEYHFNGFVWNLLTTPGGVAALGATDSTLLAVGWQVGLIFLATALVLWLALRYAADHRSPSLRNALLFFGALMLALAAEEGVYAYSTFTGQEDVLQAAEVVPFHLHTTATSLLKKIGVKHGAMSKLRIAGGEVNYPSRDLVAEPRKSYPNIIMLVGESFRWDLLDPEITPNLWKLGQESLRFENHYSGGNRTRMGLFSMFYGIYAPYWYSFEKQRVAPALMEFIRARDYQLALHTSQSFDYPEIRHTLFAGVAEQYMQEIKTGEPWKRDVQNISDIIGKLDKRDPKRPFYGFMFFESTHAPYTFPEDDAIRKDYQKDLNYINMNLKDNVGQIHARYINAAHHIDAQVGRLLEYLEKSGMKDNTIVMFTGDHGEEFMEKGHWGHGHNRIFPEEQIRVPLVMHIPGRKPELIRHRTSHLQISQTLLEQMGVRQDPLSYSSASNLFKPMPYLVVGDYDYMGLIDDQYKITFPFTSSDFFRYTVHHANDHPVARELRDQVIGTHESLLNELVKESGRFVN